MEEDFRIRIKPHLGQTKREIYEVIKKIGPISLSGIWEATGHNPNTIRSSVVSLTNAGLIERVGKGIYKAKSK
jgi:predicted transcriptional regulator of viral defense system